MNIANSHWNQIVDAFYNGPEDGKLNIAKTAEGSYLFSVAESCSSSSVPLFEELVGASRLNRICRRADLDKNSSLFLSKENVHSIFLEMMNIQKQDIEECKEPIEQSYRRLMLFENFDDFKTSFICGSQSIEALKVDKAATSGKGKQGLTEKVLILAHHHFTLLTEQNETKHTYRDAEMLTSRLADREMQKGMVVHLRDGYFYVDELFVGGGAYVAVLRDFSNQSAPKIVCRGTAMRWTATEGWQSGVNNVLLEIGMMGIKKIWPALSKYLKSRDFKTVEILGKSLGGAHAQELAVLIEGVLGIPVKNLTTYCSVGVGQKINELFKRDILSKRSSPFKIQVIRNGGAGSDDEVDYIPSVGGEHLGSGAVDKCEVEVVYISTSADVEIYPLQSGKLHQIWRFFQSFGTPHCRQTTLGDFYWKKIEHKKDADDHLIKVGNCLEKIRKIFAWIIHLLTLFLLNGKNFISYYFTSAREHLSRSI
jgi:hypothetical protein